MSPEAELRRLLAGLSPALDPARWRFAAVDPAPAEALMTFREEEGLCAILPAGDAPEAFRRITLRVQSSLHAVGLTAAVSARLTAIGVPANVVAGLRHDHVFVPEAEAARALRALEALSAESALDAGGDAE